MNTPMYVRLATGAIFTIPLWWALGLDQAAWLGGGLLLMVGLVFGLSYRALAATAAAFIGVVLLSGVIGAEGVRWLTLARDVLIILAFFSAMLGVADLVARGRSVMVLPLTVGAVVVLSSVVSLLAMILQDPFRFTTLVAPLVPEFIAETGLGRVSLMERSLGETSYFLGATFLRPQGLFLFSTSQAVAQAVVVSLLLALPAWYPSLRWILVLGALVVLVALVASTTRMPLIGLAVAFTAIWATRQFQRGAISVTIPLRGKTLGAIVGGIALVMALAVVSGIAADAVTFLTTRSLEGRAALYERTLEDWRERPLIGWGTDRDWTPRPTPSSSATPVPTLTPTPRPTPPPPSPRPTDVPPERPPLGSHSQYLGILFKQGVVGLAFYLVVLGIVFREILPNLRRGSKASDWLIIGFLVSLIASFTESLWLDPGTAIIVGVAWGVLIGVARRTRGHPPSSEAIWRGGPGASVDASPRSGKVVSARSAHQPADHICDRNRLARLQACSKSPRAAVA